MTVRAAEVPRGEKEARLWFGVFGGPVSWIIHVVAGYILEDTACAPASQSEAILGVAIEPLYIVMTLVLAAVTTFAGLTAFSMERRLRNTDDSYETQRAQWMARAGILVSILFLFIICVAFASVAILSACEVSP